MGKLTTTEKNTLGYMYENVPEGVLLTLFSIAEKTGLDPFSNEVTIQEEEGRYFVIIARDGYRRVAQAEENYDYHQVVPLYEGDQLKIVNGMPEHIQALSAKSDLIGAYGILKKKDSSRPIYLQVSLAEYASKDKFWSKSQGKPSTMICKVCESQLIRMAYQELFTGSYSDTEFVSSGKDNKRKEIEDFLREHFDISEQFIKDKGLLEMDIEELDAVRESVECILQEKDR